MKKNQKKTAARARRQTVTLGELVLRAYDRLSDTRSVAKVMNVANVRDHLGRRIVLVPA